MSLSCYYSTEERDGVVRVMDKQMEVVCNVEGIDEHLLGVGDANLASSKAGGSNGINNVRRDIAAINIDRRTLDRSIKLDNLGTTFIVRQGGGANNQGSIHGVDKRLFLFGVVGQDKLEMFRNHPANAHADNDLGVGGTMTGNDDSFDILEFRFRHGHRQGLSRLLTSVRLFQIGTISGGQDDVVGLGFAHGLFDILLNTSIASEYRSTELLIFCRKLGRSATKDMNMFNVWILSAVTEALKTHGAGGSNDEDRLGKGRHDVSLFVGFVRCCYLLFDFVRARSKDPDLSCRKR